METAAAAGFPTLIVAGWSVVLLFVHIALQGMTATRELGSAWNAGPRDEGLRPSGILAGRAERASANFRETYPAFVALALGLAVAGNTEAVGVWGAWLWLFARIVYLPLYLAGIPYIRSLVWLASAAGLVMMFVALVF